jgi:cytochrome c biogenesis protein CcmG/thiol:disulfide interchange protein DsbE
MDGTQTLETTPKRGFNAVSIAILVGLAVFIALVGVQLNRQNAPINMGIDNVAPVFTITTFDDELLDLATLEGNVVVINFWASWCGPCHAEAELLQNTWDAYKDDNFIMLGITHADVERDSLGFIDQYNITYPNAPDPGAKVYDSYGLTAVPETFVIAPDGTLAYMLRGPLTDTTTPQFIAAIESLLGEDA